MGNSQTLSCASGEKSTKAQQKEERYAKAPVDKSKENGANGDAGHEAAEPSAEQKTESVEEAKPVTTEEVKEVETKTEAVAETSEETVKPEETKPVEASTSTAPTDSEAVELKIEESGDKSEVEAKKDTEATVEVEPKAEVTESTESGQKQEETKDSSTNEEVETLSAAVMSALNNSMSCSSAGHNLVSGSETHKIEVLSLHSSGDEANTSRLENDSTQLSADPEVAIQNSSLIKASNADATETKGPDEEAEVNVARCDSQLESEMKAPEDIKSALVYSDDILAEVEPPAISAKDDAVDKKVISDDVPSSTKLTSEPVEECSNDLTESVNSTEEIVECSEEAPEPAVVKDSAAVERSELSPEPSAEAEFFQAHAKKLEETDVISDAAINAESEPCLGVTEDGNKAPDVVENFSANTDMADVEPKQPTVSVDADSSQIDTVLVPATEHEANTAEPEKGQSEAFNEPIGSGQIMVEAVLEMSKPKTTTIESPLETPGPNTEVPDASTEASQLCKGSQEADTNIPESSTKATGPDFEDIQADLNTQESSTALPVPNVESQEPDMEKAETSMEDRERHADAPSLYTEAPNHNIETQKPNAEMEKSRTEVACPVTEGTHICTGTSETLSETAEACSSSTPEFSSAMSEPNIERQEPCLETTELNADTSDLDTEASNSNIETPETTTKSREVDTAIPEFNSESITSVTEGAQLDAAAPEPHLETSEPYTSTLESSTPIAESDVETLEPSTKIAETRIETTEHNAAAPDSATKVSNLNTERQQLDTEIPESNIHVEASSVIEDTQPETDAQPCEQTAEPYAETAELQTDMCDLKESRAEEDSLSKPEFGVAESDFEAKNVELLESSNGVLSTEEGLSKHSGSAAEITTETESVPFEYEQMKLSELRPAEETLDLASEPELESSSKVSFSNEQSETETTSMACSLNSTPVADSLHTASTPAVDDASKHSGALKDVKEVADDDEKKEAVDSVAAVQESNEPEPSQTEAAEGDGK